MLVEESAGLLVSIFSNTEMSLNRGKVREVRPEPGADGM